MRNNEPLKIYHYHEGEHFQIPADVLANCGQPDTIPLLKDTDEDGNCLQGGFVSVSSPEEADYIVFPYILKQFINVMRAMWVQFYIRKLPFFRSHERKHVFFHCQDRGQPLFTEALILTCAPDRFNTDDPFITTLPYSPGRHVLRHAPDFEFEKVDLDTSFVGTLSWPIRPRLIQSIKEEPRLSSLLKFPNTLDWACKDTSYLHMDDPLRKRKLEEAFVDAMRRSWTTLCPRGMGSSSVRFFEAMSMGRIPVQVSDAYRPPLEEDINYTEFSLFIPEAEVDRAGAILRMWLAKRDLEQRMAMCRKARQVWEQYFRPETEKDICLQYLRRHLPDARTQDPLRHQPAPSPLVGDTSPRWFIPPGFYANLVMDDKRSWALKGLETAPAQDPHVILVNGVRSALAVPDLQIALVLGRNVPENGTVACSGAPSGVLGITLASGLISAKNISSRVYCVEDWALACISEDETLEAFEANILANRVEDIVSPVQSDAGPAVFRDRSVHLAVLAGTKQETILEVLEAWLVKLAPGGFIALFLPEPNGAACAAARQFAKDNHLQVVITLEDKRFLGLRKPSGCASAATKADKQDPSGAPRSAEPCPPERGDTPAGGLAGHVAGHNGQRYLAVKATGGMGNRLLGLMCAVVHSLMSGRCLCVDWSDFMYSDDGEDVFPLLFRLNGVPYCSRMPRSHDVYPEFWRGILDSNLLIEQLGINHLDPAVRESTRANMLKEYEQSVLAFWSYDLEPMQTALEDIRERLPEFAQLDVEGICREIMKKFLLPTPIISDRVDVFATQHFKGPIVGVHIRYTDLRMPLEETVRVIQGLKDSMGARIFLATDSQMIERTMFKLFGDDLIVMPKRYPKNGKHMHSNRVEGMTNFEKALDAAVEMYLLSRCDAIVRYKVSSFAKISQYCSKIPPERVICIQ